MNTKEIDEAIDVYVNDRMASGKKAAVRHFIAITHLKHQGLEIADFMKKVRGLTSYYIDYLRVIQNPFKGPEPAWLLTMLAVSAYAIYLLFSKDTMSLGIFLLVGTVINGAYLISYTAKRWCDLNVLIAIYDEIVQIVDQELSEYTP